MPNPDGIGLLPALILGYLLGSIPIGPLLGRLAGVDIQRQGSGNSGATNVARTVGKLAGIATLVGDLAKGLAAVLLVADPAHDGPGCAAALAAIVGHSYSIFLRLTGGKGVATAAGAFLGLAAIPTLVSMAAFVVVAGATRYASVASMAAALVLPIAIYIGGSPRLIGHSALVAAAFIVVRHRDNLRRLADGTEPAFRSKQPS